VSRRAAPVEEKPLIIQPAAPSEAPKELKLPEKVKIGLRVGMSEIKISCEAKIIVRDIDNKTRQEWGAGHYRFAVANRRLFVGGIPRGKKLLLASAEQGHHLQIGPKPYRGEIILTMVGGKFNVVNQLSVDDYLKGVLPREVGPTWAKESLKAQAVASRTYLVSHLGQHGRDGFDLCSDVHCQVYGGVDKEHPATNTAVDETRGEVLFYKGKPIKSFFHSNCGGSTEEAEHVWQIEHLNYLPRKKCGFGTANPRYHWVKDISNSEILRLLKAKTRVTGTKLVSIQIKMKSGSGRAEKVMVKTDTGVFTLKGNNFRIALGPEAIRSTLWTNLKKLRGSYRFEGRGWGHGVGLCQWGAKGQAEHGRGYRDILEFYYPGTQILIW